MNRERIRHVLASIPRMNDLRCIIGKISIKTMEYSSVPNSLHNERILKCRSLIHLFPEIIASPITGARNQGDIYILARPEFLLTGKIQRKLNDVNIQYSESEVKVTRQIYDACLHYTISCKIAPEWNKMIQYFIQGKYFLNSLSRPTNVINLEISLTDLTEEEVRLSVSPSSVRLHPLSLEYFSLSPHVIQNFMANDNGIISLRSSQSRTWVYVLPSVKKGKVVSVAKKIPTTSMFGDYDQLKRHWKNMYGYQLPESDDGLIYYELWFPGIGPTCHTYPSCCVGSDKLMECRLLEDAGDIASRFLQDLVKRVPQICGTSLILEEIHPSLMHNSRREEVEKENIPKTESRGARNAGRVLYQQTMLQDTCSRSNRDSIFSRNYIYPFTSTRNKTDDYSSTSSTLFDNPGSSRPERDIIKGKNLREDLNTEQSLRAQSANRKGLAPCSNQFPSVIGNTRRTAGSDDLEILFDSYKDEPRSRKLLLPERRTKVETIRSSQLIETNPEEPSAAVEVREETDSFYNSLLRSRSSFDLNDFGTLGGENLVEQIVDKNLASNVEEDSVKKEMEIKSCYFEDLENKKQNNEKVSELGKTSLKKLKLYRVSDGKKLATPKVPRLISESEDRPTCVDNKKQRLTDSEY